MSDVHADLDDAIARLVAEGNAQRERHRVVRARAHGLRDAYVAAANGDHGADERLREARRSDRT